MPIARLFLFLYLLKLANLSAQEMGFDQNLELRALYEQLNLLTLDKVKPEQIVFLSVQQAHLNFCKDRGNQWLLSVKTYVQSKKNPSKDYFELRADSNGHALHELHLSSNSKEDLLMQRAQVMRDFMITVAQEGMSCSRYKRRYDVYDKELKPITHVLGSKNLKDLASKFAFKQVENKRVDATKKLDDPNFYGDDLLSTELTSSQKSTITTSSQ